MPFPLKPNIHVSASSHTRRKGRDEKRQQSYHDSATFQGSSPRWQLTSLLLPPSHTDDIILTHTERPRSFQAQFISFYGCKNSVLPKSMATGQHTPRSSVAPFTSSKAPVCHGTREEVSRSWDIKQGNGT